MPNFKFSFALPKGQQVALADASGISILNKYIPQKDISIIDIEQLNVFAVLRMLFAGKKSLFDYTVAYIKTFKPQFVFTFLDNNVDFYKLAAIFPKTKFIAVQNGQRANYANQIDNGFFDLLKNEFRKTEKDDYINLTFGYAYDPTVRNPEVYKFISNISLQVLID